MSWLSRLFATFRTKRMDRDAEVEMRFHLDMEAEAAMRRGFDAAEARRETRLRAGTVAGAMEEVRDQRGLPSLAGSIADLRHAAVALSHRRGFTAAATVALALAVAVNALIFALFDGVLLRPLPYPEPDRLVRIFDSNERNPQFPMSAGNFLDYRRESRTLESLALYHGGDLHLSHDDRPERVSGVRVSAEFFPLLGVAPMIGRNFTEAEMRGSPRVVILSHRIWRTRFHGDRAIAGKTIRLDRASWTVVGVLPPGFQHIGGAYNSPLHGETVDLWWPVRLDLRPQGMRGWHFMNAVGRMRPGVATQDVHNELNRIADDIRRRIPDSTWRARVMPLTEELVGDSNRTVWLLMLAGAVVLAIACANVAGLCVARALTRRRDLAIRQALGAGLWRLVRTQLSENLLLGVAGGAAGLALAIWLMPVLRALLPADFPRIHEVRLGVPGALVAFASALATSLLAGLVPSWRQARTHPRDALSGESRTASAAHGERRLRGSLVTAQVALATFLCVWAALLLRSSILLDQRDHGFRDDGILTFRLSLPEAAYGEDEKVAGLLGELERRWRSLPGVRAAGFATSLPWTGHDENTSFNIVNRVTDPDSTQARYQSASPGWFHALRVPVLKGRIFAESDTAASPPVIVINESMAHRYFPDADPIGQAIDTWGKQWRIVGVVADIRDYPADAQAEPAFWWPMTQQPFSWVRAVLHTAGEPLAIAGSAGRALHAIDPELPIADVTTVDRITRAARAERRFTLWLFQVFTALAMTLAAFGIYGLLAYSVEQRRKEIGIRTALGATRGRITSMVLRDGLALAFAGLLIGVVAAPVASRVLASFLFGVTATDALSFAAVPVVILAVSVIASLVPAIAAAREEPLSALRQS